MLNKSFAPTKRHERRRTMLDFGYDREMSGAMARARF
jgi:hypothetical protein